ncbi:MAG TPA: hypothetical protein VMR70_00610, partial [Flavisolibacter sp.]|nr:hypothetical protein [Flavisolibacter sp.]
YFQKELNIPVYFSPKVFQINHRSFYIGHGDGLGPGDHGYKMLKKIFRSPLCQWLFGLVPPVIGMGLADYFSGKSRGETHHPEEKFLGEDKEWLLIYSREMLRKEPHNFFVFGHRHLPIDYRLSTESRYINLGEWMNYQTYAVFDGTYMSVHSFTGKDSKIVRKD